MTNAITRVEIKDFLVFKGEFAADFCPGVNVIIGGNGSGKTTLLRALYLPFILARQKLHERPGSLDWQTNRRVGGFGHTQDSMAKINYAEKEIEYLNTPMKYCELLENVQAVFIPAAEMLSHSKGLIALSKDLRLPFDQTQIDILNKAQRPVTNEVKANALRVLCKIKELIGGEVEYEDDSFYVKKENGETVPFSLEADGFRRLGLLWKLLRNGLLESGSILFWDEPEASINPELIPALVDILLELQKGGVQIFAATHSYDVARWFELNKGPANTLRYFNLRKKGRGIIADTADDYISLDNNVIDVADEKLYRRVVEVMAANAGVRLE